MWRNDWGSTAIIVCLFKPWSAATTVGSNFTLNVAVDKLVGRHRHMRGLRDLAGLGGAELPKQHYDRRVSAAVISLKETAS
jgi:hypothetical protein